MIKKILIPVLIAIFGVGLMMYVFLSQSSPYVTIREGKTQKGDQLHLVGDIIPGSIQNNISTASMSFILKDQAGDHAQVIYQGTQPSNMGSVTKVVAIGSFRKDIFYAHKLLIKCPSKYEVKS